MKVAFTPRARAEWVLWMARADVAPVKVGGQLATMARKLDGLPFFPRKAPRTPWAPGTHHLVTRHIRLVYRLDFDTDTIHVLAVRDCRENPAKLRRLG